MGCSRLEQQTTPFPRLEQDFLVCFIALSPVRATSLKDGVGTNGLYTVAADIGTDLGSIGLSELDESG